MTAVKYRGTVINAGVVGIVVSAVLMPRWAVTCRGVAPRIDDPLYSRPEDLPPGAPDSLPAKALINAAVWAHFDGVLASTVSSNHRKARRARREAKPGEVLSRRLMPEGRIIGGAPYWTVAQYRARKLAQEQPPARGNH